MGVTAPERWAGLPSSARDARRDAGAGGEAVEQPLRAPRRPGACSSDSSRSPATVWPVSPSRDVGDVAQTSTMSGVTSGWNCTAR